MYFFHSKPNNTIKFDFIYHRPTSLPQTPTLTIKVCLNRHSVLGPQGVIVLKTIKFKLESVVEKLNKLFKEKTCRDASAFVGGSIDNI